MSYLQFKLIYRYFPCFSLYVARIEEIVMKAVENSQFLIHPDIWKTMKNSVFQLMFDSASNPPGVVFYVAKHVLLSAAHNIPKKFNECHVENASGKPLAYLKLVKMNRKDDWAIFEELPRKCYEDAKPLKYAKEISEEILLKPLALVGFNLGIVTEARDISTRGITHIRASAVKLEDNHILFDYQSFAGDSGAALLMGDGMVLGVPVEHINGIINELSASDEEATMEQVEDLTSNKKKKIPQKNATTVRYMYMQDCIGSKKKLTF